MKIDNKAIRERLAENAAQRTGDGPWQVICKDLDEPTGLIYRKMIVALGRVENDRLDVITEKIKANSEMGSHYNSFIRRYNKAYREIEEFTKMTGQTVKKFDQFSKEDAKIDVKKAEAVSTEEEFTPDELKKINSVKKRLHTDPTVALFDEFNELVLPWSNNKGERAMHVLGQDARAALVVLRGIKEKRAADMAAAREAITEKIPRSEIEAEKAAGWDIDVEIFYPISIGVVTGRLGPIAEAIEIFGWAFDGRALPELTAIATILMIDKYEGNFTKLMTYYSSMVVALSKLSDSLASVAAAAARKRMESLLGLEDVAGSLMKTLSGAIIEEGV